nr:GGDEF domain-containing protein [Lachnospiraceae bacterium]
PNRSLVGVILIDIDHFKAYNDTFGHPEGDVCLQKVAASLASTVKKFGKEGIVSRIGGEEFLIFLYGYKKEMFYNIAETVRTDVENLRLKHATGPNDVVTISLGLNIERAKPETNLQVLYDKADKLLYKAKESGRNRVCCNLSAVGKNGVKK